VFAHCGAAEQTLRCLAFLGEVARVGFWLLQSTTSENQSCRLSNEHIDPSPSHMNVILASPSDARTVAADARRKMSEAGIDRSKLRKNASTLIEALFCISLNAQVDGRAFSRTALRGRCGVSVPKIFSAQCTATKLLLIATLSSCPDEFDANVSGTAIR